MHAHQLSNIIIISCQQILCMPPNKPIIMDIHVMKKKNSCIGVGTWKRGASWGGIAPNFGALVTHNETYAPKPVFKILNKNVAPLPKSKHLPRSYAYVLVMLDRYNYLSSPGMSQQGPQGHIIFFSWRSVDNRKG